MKALARLRVLCRQKYSVANLAWNKTGLSPVVLAHFKWVPDKRVCEIKRGGLEKSQATYE